MKKLILASGSPRRREMLEKLGIPLKIAVSNCDETFPEGTPIAEAVRVVAERKATDVKALNTEWVLAADTVVMLGERLLGKPNGDSEAASMLEALSGQTHTVLTGVALLHRGAIRSLSVATKVSFQKLTAAQIRWYVGTGEPMDKAGAYAIQGLAASFVERIRGSYTNVVGLPLAETMELLETAGFTPWSSMAAPQATVVNNKG